MKRTCKRLTALILALSMCLSLLSATAWAADVETEEELTAEIVEEDTDEEEAGEPETETEAEPAEEEAAVSATEDSSIVDSGTCGTGVTYTLTEDGTLTISGTGEIESCAFEDNTDILELIIESGITSIGSFAFWDCRSLASITIGDSVTSIGMYAFGACKSLTYINIPDSVTTIDRDAFGSCSALISVTIPDSVTSIGTNAFSQCTSLTSVTIPDSITSLSDYTFYCCSSLTSVTIPDSVSSIGMRAFAYCKNLTDVYYTGSQTEWESITIGSENEYLTSATIHYNYFEHDHDYKSVVAAPTCTEEGYTTYTCTLCGESYVTDKTDALGHTWNEGTVTKEPTATEDGEKTYTCTICGATKTETVEATGVIDLSTCTVTLSASSYTCDGSAKKPTVTVKDAEGNTLTGGTDYTVSYSNNVNYGTATVTVTGLGDYTGTVQKTFTIKALSTPTLSSVSNTTSGVKITWKAVTGAAKYRVFRKTGSGSWTKVADTTSTSYTDKTAASGTTYKYTVRCVTSDGKYYTSSYNTTGLTIKYLTAGKVSSLTNTSTGITVKWSKVSGASGYKIYRKTSSGSYSLIKTITSGSTVSYSDTAVKSKNGTTYVYAVRPYSGSYTGSYTGKTAVRLTGVSISSLKNSASKKMTVKWGKNAKATGYQIQYSTSSSFSSGNKTVTVSGASSLSKTISSLTQGKTYYVRVRAYKTVSDVKYYSAWSAKKSVQLPNISKTSATLVIGGTLTLKMTGTTKTVKWSTSNKSVATVSSSGKVTAKKKGTATITAKVDGISYTCKVTVVKKVLSVSASSVSISSTGKVTVTLDGNGSVDYKIADTSVVSCAWGKWSGDDVPLTITGKKVGSTKITITNSINSQTCVVTVTVKKAATYAQPKYVMAAYAIDRAYNSAKYPSTLHIYGMTYKSGWVNGYGDTIDRLVLECYAMNGFGGYSTFYVVVLKMDKDAASNYSGTVAYDDYYLTISTYNSSPGLSGSWLDNATALKAYQYVFGTTRVIEYD